MMMGRRTHMRDSYAETDRRTDRQTDTYIHTHRQTDIDGQTDREAGKDR